MRATRKSLRQTLNLTNDAPRAIAGAAFWHSLLGLGRVGEPLTPVYTWADGRGADDAVRLRAEFDEHQIQQRILELLEGAIGRAKKIIVSGGILQSPASLQILADTLGRNLETCADQEASLRGAAVHALEQLETKVLPPKRGRRIRPHPKNSIRA